LLGVIAWLALGCGRAPSPDENANVDRPEKPAAATPPTPAASASKPAPADTTPGNLQTIHARTMKGDETEVSVQAPAGWTVMAAPTSPDPHAGTFTLAQATKGLPKQGTLAARIQTPMGALYCDLFDDEAPNTVANFVGLARGLRKFWDTKKLAWLAEPYYDGTTFHRAKPGLMIQGGDRSGSGRGYVGYTIPDELSPTLTHDRPGQLCLFSQNKDSGSAQFFVTEAPTPHLEGHFPVLGQCEPVTLVQRISHMPQATRGFPDAPVVIEKLEIRRVVGGAAKWRPKGEVVPPIPGLPAPGRAVLVQ
jgi:peptidyl-prolyl cis-trans isomerase A (cyclophilin A)